MTNHQIISEITDIQNSLIIPECFEPDKAKIRDALPDIIKRMMIGSCGLGDILVACEIFKDWLKKEG